MIGEKEQMQGRTTVTTRPTNPNKNGEKSKWKLFLGFVSGLFKRTSKGVTNHFEGEAERRRNEANKLKKEEELFAQRIAESATEIASKKQAMLEKDFELIDALKLEKDPKIMRLKLKMLLKERPHIKEFIEELTTDEKILKVNNFCEISFSLKKNNTDIRLMSLSDSSKTYSIKLHAQENLNWELRDRKGIKNIVYAAKGKAKSQNLIILHKELPKKLNEEIVALLSIKISDKNKTLSEQAIKFLRKNEIDTLGDLISYNLEDIRKLADFNVDIQSDLIKLVDDYKLEFGLDLSNINFNI